MLQGVSVKINVSGTSPIIHALRRRLHLQETQLEAVNPDIVFDDESVAVEIPTIVVENLFDNFTSTGEFTHFFSRYWHEGKWHNQLAVGFPILGFMNDNLGVPVPVGCGVRIAKNFSPRLYENPGFEEFLNNTKVSKGEFKFNGFVSFLMSHDKLLAIQKGVPAYGLFAILEGLVGRVEQLLTQPFSVEFRRRWYTSNLLSIPPFPSVLHASQCRQSSSGEAVLGKRPLVTGISHRLEQHFWAFAPTGVQKQSFYAAFSQLGVATAWSDTLFDSCARTLVTCRNVEVENKQYRTDIYHELSRRMSLGIGNGVEW